MDYNTQISQQTDLIHAEDPKFHLWSVILQYTEEAEKNLSSGLQYTSSFFRQIQYLE